jgi:post-segregation antitoxin (ccd killing protein)
VREEKKKRWFKENQQAIQQHNQQVSETGTFSESIGQLKLSINSVFMMTHLN